MLGIYRKMHIPDDPLYYEKFYFTPGDTGFLNFDTRTDASGRSCAGISGIPKAPACRAWAERACCSIHGDRLAPFGKRAVWSRATRRLADDSARPCDR